jgi:hypothetical protein
VRTCPECGHENAETDRFCSNCGANLANVSTTPEPESTTTTTNGFPPPVDFSVPTGTSVEDEWRMSSLGPPAKPKRRLWLWILVGFFALCLLVCVGLVAFSLTDTGQNWIEDLATEAATQQAD